MARTLVGRRAPVLHEVAQALPPAAAYARTRDIPASGLCHLGGSNSAREQLGEIEPVGGQLPR
jgi:hypothetical protein